jgi:hypothetical protein
VIDIVEGDRCRLARFKPRPHFVNSRFAFGCGNIQLSQNAIQAALLARQLEARRAVTIVAAGIVLLDVRPAMLFEVLLKAAALLGICQ